jgi:hypothetical protein
MSKPIEIEGSGSVDWIYPEIYKEPKGTLTISLIHTRAAANIRISYDSENDLWVIEKQFESGKFKTMAQIEGQ